MKEATILLLNCLNDEVAVVQKATITALKTIGDNKAIEPLISLYKQNPHYKIKALITNALVHFVYDDFDLEFLLGDLNEERIYLQKQIIFTLGNKRYQKSTQPLIATPLSIIFLKEKILLVTSNRNCTDYRRHLVNSLFCLIKKVILFLIWHEKIHSDKSSTSFAIIFR